MFKFHHANVKREQSFVQYGEVLNFAVWQVDQLFLARTEEFSNFLFLL